LSRIKVKLVLLAAAAATALSVFSGCGVANNGLDPSRLLGTDIIAGQPGPIFSGVGSPNVPTTSPQAVIGDSCAGKVGVCLALKYVSYIDPSSAGAVVSQAAAIANVRGINSLWSQCGLGFQIEQYQAVNADKFGLNFETAALSELDRIRNQFGDNGELLVVTTGAWDRNGTLGNSTANAWTTMPGGGPHGVVLEEPVANFSNIIGHELGHYLNLLHVQDEHALMNPIIHADSMALSADQCSIVRSATQFFWAKMYR